MRNCAVRLRMAFIRIFWLVVFTVLYARLVFRTKPDEDVMSAVRGEAVDEFFPDAGKASERLKESEVTAGLKEQLHADDVAQNLGWFTNFCREKAGTDDHIRDSWTCRMVQTRIGPSHPPRWDLSTNGGLIDDQVEDRTVREKLPFMQRRELSPEEKEEVASKERQLQKVCSPAFLRRYVAIGNDPEGLVSKLHVGYGDVEEFAENVLKAAGIDEISDEFDEYTVLDKNSMFIDQAAMVDRELELTDRLDRIDALLAARGKGLGGGGGGARAKQEEKGKKEKAEKAGKEKQEKAKKAEEAKKGKEEAKKEKVDHKAAAKHGAGSKSRKDLEENKEAKGKGHHKESKSREKEGTGRDKEGSKSRKSGHEEGKGGKKEAKGGGKDVKGDHKHRKAKEESKQEGGSRHKHKDKEKDNAEQKHKKHKHKDVESTVGKKKKHHKEALSAFSFLQYGAFAARSADADTDDDADAAADVLGINTSAASRSRAVTEHEPRGAGHTSRFQQREARRARHRATSWSKHNAYNGSEALREVPSLLQTSAHLARKFRRRRHRPTRPEEKSKEEEEDDDEGDEPYSQYPPGCFARAEVMAQIREVYFQQDPDLNGKLTAKEFLQALEVLYNDKSDEERKKILQKLDKTSGSNYDIKDFMSLVKSHKDIEEMTLNPHGYLLDECRNHHWGLLALCKPEWVEARYLINEVKRKPKGAIQSTQFMKVTIRFDALGADTQSGWYRAGISLRSGRLVKDFGILDLVMLMVWFLLLMCLLLVEGLWTLIRLPGRLLAIRNLRKTHGEDPDKLVAEFSAQFARLTDGRGVRHHFLSPMSIILEDIIAFSIPFAVLVSLIGAQRPSVLPGQVDDTSQTCTQAFIESEKLWADKYFNSEEAIRGLSTFEAIRQCPGDMPQVGIITALCFQAFHQYAHRLHITALVALMLRCLGLLVLWQPLHWIADTAYLARGKLAYFMFVFLSIIFGFSVAMRVMFGAEYMQFNSLWMSIATLMLYTFGDTDRATYAVYPFIEASGTHVIICLLIYTIFVVTIGLSFFTTVILDAYSCAQDAEECARQEAKSERQANKQIIWMYYGAEVDIHLRKAEEEQEVRSQSSAGDSH